MRYIYTVYTTEAELFFKVDYPTAKELFEGFKGTHFVKRKDTTTNFQDACDIKLKNSFITVEYMDGKGVLSILRNEDDIEGWAETLARGIWKIPDNTPFVEVTGKSPEVIVDTAVVTEDHHPVESPDYYQSYMVVDDGNGVPVAELQWLEAMQYLPRYRRNPEVFEGAVELQVRKYLDRLGGKDSEAQELGKAVWYLKFLRAFVANGRKPIRVKNIDKILEGL